MVEGIGPQPGKRFGGERLRGFSEMGGFRSIDAGEADVNLICPIHHQPKSNKLPPISLPRGSFSSPRLE